MNSKIKNKKGVTIIHALVSVLIFGVFASILLNSTSSNINSVRTQKEYQQAYLSVSNAADLFLDSIDGDTITYDVVYSSDKSISWVDNWAYNEKNDSLNNPLVTSDVDDDSDFLDLLKSSKNSNVDFDGVRDNYQIKISKENTFSDVVDVEVIVKNFNIVANFSLANAKNNNNYYMSIYIPIMSTYKDIDGNDIPFDIIENSGEKSNGNKSYSNTITETYLVEYNIDEIEVKKGVGKHE